MHANEPEVGTAVMAKEWWPILGGCAVNVSRTS